jgi:hypothetical protein
MNVAIQALALTGVNECAADLVTITAGCPTHRVLCDEWDCAAYSTCFVMFRSTPTHIRVTNSDDPP